MTCTTHGEHAVQTDGENDDPNPHIRSQPDPQINLDQNTAVEEQGEEIVERTALPELRGRHRGHPPILKKKKSSYDLRDIFQTQEAASSPASTTLSSPVMSTTSSPVVPSPDANKVTSPDEIIGAPAQTKDLNRDAQPHDKNVPEDQAQDASI